MPGENGALENVVVGVNNTTDLWTLAHLPYRLPQGVYVLENDHDCGVRGGLPLGWALGAYNYTRYQKVKRDPAQLLVTDESVLTESQRLAAATFLVRDLINTPSNDMGPVELAEIAEQVAAVGGASFSVISGDDLLIENYPTIHAVGRGSSRTPRLIDIRWGSVEAPKVT